MIKISKIIMLFLLCIFFACSSEEITVAVKHSKTINATHQLYSPTIKNNDNQIIVTYKSPKTSISKHYFTITITNVETQISEKSSDSESHTDDNNNNNNNKANGEYQRIDLENIHNVYNVGDVDVLS